MVLWVDKHRPTKLDQLRDERLATRLGRLAERGVMPHLLLYGPPGSGKKTIAMALLQALFGPSVFRTRIDHRSVKNASRRSVEVSTLASNFHIELNVGDSPAAYQRLIVQDLLKDVAGNVRLDAGSSSSPSAAAFKVVVLTEAHALSRDAQAALRRTMERFSPTCRLILLSQSSSKIIEPVRSHGTLG
eukprot:PLAT13679.1.p1 GENE.PLAT13679.1~~PLAT13679.1.p1  ORF type:complete len:188 (+),score=66.88 PLAT13679.1:24-587(+)